MKKYLLLLIVMSSFFITAKSQESNDFYLWNTSAVKMELNEKMSMKLSMKTHYLASSGIRDMSFVDLSLTRNIKSWLNLGVAIRGAQINSSTNQFYEYRPQFVTTMMVDVCKIKCQTTNRMEYLFYTEGEGCPRYYHNVFLDFPSFLGFIPKSYVGEEVFTKLNDVGTHLARLYGGLHIWETNLLVLDLYYAWQMKKSDENWSGANVLGLNVTFSI